MSKYSFASLDPLEFEQLVLDLIERKLEVRCERFKAGKDDGIDGRFRLNNSTAIIQCKHYINSTFSSLINNLSKEAIKVSKLHPQKYILATSLGLTPSNKAAILRTIPELKTTENILGQDDLAQLLSKYSDIERKHYKLWMVSTSVLQTVLNSGVYTKSDYELENIRDEFEYYAQTEFHNYAYEKLVKDHVVIITGLAGVGKTTLAKQLCFQSVGEKYEFIAISNITEAFDVYNSEIKQVFYFDDFLGSNFLSALQRNEDSEIIKFIKMIKKTDTRLVLTSRSNILNQAYALSEKFERNKTSQCEYVIEIAKLSTYDRSNILYKTLSKATLEKELFHAFLNHDFFNKIVNHKSYNPRLLEFITNSEMRNSEKMDLPAYISWIKECFNNPEVIWEKPFLNQLDEISRRVVLLVASNTYQISESDLILAFDRWNLMQMNRPGVWANDFYTVIKPLCGYFLNRNIYNPDNIFYEPFNPSLTDFILSYLKKNLSIWEQILLCLQNHDCTKALLRYYQESSTQSQELIANLSESILTKCELNQANHSFILELLLLCHDEFFRDYSHKNFNKIWGFVSSLEYPFFDSLYLRFYLKFCAYFKSDDNPSILEFLIFLLKNGEFDLLELESLSKHICNQHNNRSDLVLAFKENLDRYWEGDILQYVLDNIDNYIIIDDEGHIYENKDSLIEDMKCEMGDLAIQLSYSELDSFVSSISLRDIYKDSKRSHSSMSPLFCTQNNKEFNFECLSDLYESKYKI